MLSEEKRRRLEEEQRKSLQTKQKEANVVKEAPPSIVELDDNSEPIEKPSDHPNEDVVEEESDQKQVTFIQTLFSRLFH